MTMEARKAYIYHSHQKCLSKNFNPDDLPVPGAKLPENALEQKKRMLDDTIAVARIFMTRFISDLDGTAVVICITDHEGYIMEIYGDEQIKGQIESLGLIPGIRLEEEQVGTNSIAMALHMEEAAHTIGSDHFFRCLHESACFSVPFHSSGKINGTITTMMSADHVSPYYLGLLRSAVDSIEREVITKKQNKKLLVLNQVLMENSRNGVVLANEDGTIVEINPYAETVLALKKDEINNRHIREVAVIGAYMESVLSRSTKVEDLEIAMSNKTFLFDSFPIYDEANQIIGVFGQFRDITERLVLERQLMLSEKLSAIGKIAAGLAHEIRNPLTSIIGLLALLRDHFRPADQKQKDYFRIIFTELERIKNLVQQFVMMAKPDQKETLKTRVGLHELIEDILALMEIDFQDKNIKIHYRPLYKDEMCIDKDKMKQVILNLLQNAFDAIDFDGNISVSIRQSEFDHGIEIVISDDGVGMDEDTLDKLATPFHSTKKYGLGLGLSMSYSIIELHKGSIKAESEHGKGTTFTIWLPQT